MFGLKFLRLIQSKVKLLILLSINFLKSHELSRNLNTSLNSFTSILDMKKWVAYESNKIERKMICGGRSDCPFLLNKKFLIKN
jgi:hypothetical protein